MISILLALSLAAADEPFYWGVANSSFQVEGQPADSDWARWSRIPGNIQDGSNAEVATDFWNRYDEDFTLAQDMNANAFRISVAWERIEPQKGVFSKDALDQYEQMIVAMRARGLEPFVTLHHLVTPQWLAEEGGALSPEFFDLFARYAVKTIERLSAPPAKVKFWMSFNEPLNMEAGYSTKWWPPCLDRGPEKGHEAFGNFALAHVAAAREIQKRGFPVKFGLVYNWEALIPKTWSPFDRAATKIVRQTRHNYFMKILFTGKSEYHSVEMPPRNPVDFLGLNYYIRFYVSFSLLPPFFKLTGGDGPVSDLWWESAPEGIYEAIKEASKWGVPLAITENGTADKDDKIRSEFVRGHVENVLRAKKDGYPIFGYLHWSLTDNFEWALGESGKFGLVAIDYKTLKRTPRPSYYTFKNLITK